MEVEFSHKELSLALFALEGGKLPDVDKDPCSEPHEMCPIVEDLEERFGLRSLSGEERLSQHLGKHLRQSWVDSGLLGLTADGADQIGKTEMVRIQQHLKAWSCKIRLEEAEREILSGAIAKLPRSAWISMPRTIWRLRRKLKDR